MKSAENHELQRCCEVHLVCGEASDLCSPPVGVELLESAGFELSRPVEARRGWMKLGFWAMLGGWVVLGDDHCRESLGPGG